MATRSVLSKGWRFKAPGGNFKRVLQLEEFQIPFEKSSDAALLRMQAAPISQVDLDQVRGFSVSTGNVAGLSGVGVVAEAGAASGLKEGDRVGIYKSLGGTWATHATASSTETIKLPTDIPLEYASVFASGPLTAYSILKNSGLKKGDLVVVNGAHTLVGLCTMQVAKHLGYSCVGVSSAPELLTEKIKQMGLDVVTEAGSIAEKASLAINVCGGYSAASLASLVGESGKLVNCGAPSDEPMVIPNGVSVEAFSMNKVVKDQDSIVELCDLIKANKLKAFLLRHELANIFSAIDDASMGSQQVVLMHEGTEKTWANASRDEYMKIDEQLSSNWDSATLAQEPFLKSGREQPWGLAPGAVADDFGSQVSEELKAKLASVQSEEQLVALIDSMSTSEKEELGIPHMDTVTMTAEQLKSTLAALEAKA